VTQLEKESPAGRLTTRDGDEPRKTVELSTELGVRPERPQVLSLTPSRAFVPTSAFSVIDNLVIFAEKYLRQDPTTQAYNVREDSVPEHKVALLKA
jgi:hypothetical protein